MSKDVCLSFAGETASFVDRTGKTPADHTAWAPVMVTVIKEQIDAKVERLASQAINIVMESLLWQENMRVQPVLLGPQIGIDTNLKKVRA